MLTSYAQLLKANGFINISVHGGSFDGDAVSEFGIKFLHIDDASLPGTISHDQGATFADTGQLIFQGGGVNNLVNNQHSRVKNTDATAKTSEAVPDPISAGAGKTIPLDMGGKKTVLAELHTDRFTLYNWKCYLDICAAYHTFFV